MISPGRHAREEGRLLLVGARAAGRPGRPSAPIPPKPPTRRRLSSSVSTRCWRRRHLGPAVLTGPVRLQPPAGALLLPELAVERPPVGVLLEVPLEALVLGRHLLVEPGPDLVPQLLELRCGGVRDLHGINPLRPQPRLHPHRCASSRRRRPPLGAEPARADCRPGAATATAQRTPVGRHRARLVATPSGGRPAEHIAQPDPVVVAHDGPGVDRRAHPADHR